MALFDKIVTDIPRLLAEYGVHVAGSLIFLLVAWFFARVVDRLLRRVLARSTELDGSYVAFIARTVRIAIMAIATVAVLEELGVEIASLIAALGIFGFAIALGLRTSLSNFFMGLMIFVLKPYDVGDHIEGERVDGVVKRIGTFHTVVITADGVYVSVPNAAMWARSIRNLSRPQPFRVDLSLTVGRELPFAELKPIIEKIIRADRSLHAVFPPEIRIVDSAELTLTLRIAAWCAAEDAWAFGNRLKSQIDAALVGAGATVKKLITVRKRPRTVRKPTSRPKDQGEDFA